MKFGLSLPISQHKKLPNLVAKKSNKWPKLVNIKKATNFGFVPDWSGDPHQGILGKCFPLSQVQLRVIIMWSITAILHEHMIFQHTVNMVNPLWPSDTIQRHRSGSILVHGMAWCLTAPSHYLNQCWLFIDEVLWHSTESNFTASAKVTVLYNVFANCTLTRQIWGIW